MSDNARSGTRDVDMEYLLGHKKAILSLIAQVKDLGNQAKGCDLSTPEGRQRFKELTRLLAAATAALPTHSGAVGRITKRLPMPSSQKPPKK